MKKWTQIIDWYHSYNFIPFSYQYSLYCAITVHSVCDHSNCSSILFFVFVRYEFKNIHNTPNNISFCFTIIIFSWNLVLYSVRQNVLKVCTHSQQNERSNNNTQIWNLFPVNVCTSTFDPCAQYKSNGKKTFPFFV